MTLKKQILLLLLLCGLNFFVNNGYLRPDIMEARNLITAREMAEKGNWLNPTMNNYPRLAKPPLPTWINGAIAYITPVSNWPAHRVPGALIGTLAVLSVFFIGRAFKPNSLQPFFAAAVAATSYYLILMSRQASWDIYCHALMTTAIYFFISGWNRNKASYLNHSIAGVFLGLSFMSKGPVAFYALLIPFLVSWVIFIDNKVFINNWKPLLLSLLMFLIVGMSWPIYQLITNYDLLMQTLNAETTAWSERHVRPFYQYWGFWSHTGIWSIFALIGMFFPYARKRISKPQYYFVLSWIILIVILLSVPAEKKERYLLPVVIPLSLLIGHYINYLFTAWQQHQLEATDKNILRFMTLLLSLICLAITVFFFLQQENLVVAIFTAIIFIGLAALLIRGLYLMNLKWLILGYISLMTSISLVIIPQANSFTEKNSKYQSMATLRDKEAYEYPFYAKNINPKQILELGKPVDTLRYHNELIIVPPEKRFVLLLKSDIKETDFNERIKSLTLLDTIFYDPKNKDRRYLVYETAL